MGGCRQICSLWFYIKKVVVPYHKNFSRWRCLKELLMLRVDNRYFWHDSFGKHINRLFVCRVMGHIDVRWIGDGGCSGDRPLHYCFGCDSEVDPGVDRIRTRNGEPG